MVDAGSGRGLSADRGADRVPPHAAGTPHRQDRGPDAHTAFARPDRSYLVTGGLGALGRSAHGGVPGPAGRRRHRVDQPSRRTPRPSRPSPPSPIGSTAGCTSSPPTSAMSQAAALLDRIRAPSCRRWPASHLAGVLDDALLQQTPERFRTALRPKAFGAHHLHRLTQDDDLGSSCTRRPRPCWVRRHQANYACANALLDGLVAHRRGARDRRRPPPTSAWGRAGGMATPRRHWPT